MTRRLKRAWARLADRLRPAQAAAEGTHLSEVAASDLPLWESSLGDAVGPSVLIATGTGGHTAVTPVEALLAASLTLRGARVHVLLCDGALPACMECEILRYPDPALFAETGPQADRCEGCYAAGRRVFEGAGLDVHTYSEMLTDDDAAWAHGLAQQLTLSQMQEYVWDGLRIGEHAKAGVLRFFIRGDLSGEPSAEPIQRRYFEAALLTAMAARRAVVETGATKSVFHHGIYVPQGIVGEVMRAEGVEVVNWNVAYRTGCFIFSHGGSYHHTLISEPVETWQDMPWDSARETVIREYLRSRWHGTQDWIWFHENPETGMSHIQDELGLDLSKPTVGLLTNVVWDAQLHYPENAFPGMLDWLLRTIEYFRGREDLQLLIRIHPAEIRGTLPSRQPVAEEIESAFPDLPPNVFVIRPESAISTYAAMERCDSVIIYGTKTGVELASMGIPVIVAGEAWIRGKGISIDAQTAEDYFRILDTLPFGRHLDEETVARARKYAYHFFMRRMIPLDMLAPTGQWPPYRLEVPSLDGLLPGRSHGLDVVCDGILKGSGFIYDAEVPAGATPDV